MSVAADRAARNERRAFEAEHPISGPMAETLLYTPSNTQFEAAAPEPASVAFHKAHAEDAFKAVAERPERLAEQIVQSDEERAARAAEAAAALPEDAETEYRAPGVNPKADAEDAAAAEPSDLADLSKSDLQDRAKAAGVSGYSSMNKDELIDALTEAEDA